MANTGPFYFKLVDPTDKTFDHTRHNGWDFEIFEFVRTLEENVMPKLELVIKNPLRGLLDPAFNVWAWFSYHDVVHDVWYPLFFGRIIGQPKQLIGMKIQIELIGWPLDYVLQKQQVAEQAKVDPFYEPLAIAVKDRDNPDVILEANTKLFHIDHLTGAVSLSDIINAEDGNTAFTADQVFYNYLDQTVGDPPKVAILLEMETSWTQRWRGYVQLPDFAVSTYSGDGFISEWPKPGAGLGGGYSVFDSSCVDINRVNYVVSITVGYELRVGGKDHMNGDMLTNSLTMTYPVLGGPSLNAAIFWNIQPGVVNPFATDIQGDPAPINKPASSQVNSMYIPLWNIRGTLLVKIQAERPRTEKVVLTLNGNFQPILVNPTVQQNTETITVQLADVGIPIIELLNWTEIAGQAVTVDMVIFPDNPLVPSGTSIQVITNVGSGHAAPFGKQPAFSDIPGVITTDINGVQYTSLGTTSPTFGNQDWVSDLPVSGGTIILPREPLWIYWTSLTKASFLQFPPVGSSVAVKQVIRGSNQSYWVCQEGGITNLREPNWSSTWGDTITDGSVVWRCLGMFVPTGNDFFVALADGITGAPYVIPPFNTSRLHAQTSDGTITWVYIGTGEIPIGGTVENTTGDVYFPSDRGGRTLRYGIAKLRARMLNTLRCVTTKFQVSFMDGINLTTRMSSTLSGEDRIPGSNVGGKNTLLRLSGSGSGKFRTEITIQSCVGLDGTITPVAGTPVYALAGLFQPGIQRMDDAVILLPTLTDVGYTPPVRTVVDDGVTFPIRNSDSIVLQDTIEGNLDAQVAGINSAIKSAILAASLPYKIVHTIQEIIDIQKEIVLANSNTVGVQLSRAPIWRNLQLKPLNVGPYGGYYQVKLTQLQGPKQIDLRST